MSESYQTGASGLPERLGIFRILGLLGEGGSGVVYAARWGHREVALKVLHPTLVVTQRERERFLDEAKLLADITHAAVVKVLTFGAMPDGRPFLAMEKLDGETLAARLARGGRLEVPVALDLFGQLCGAVEALHQAGLVHRDLKPENIFLVADGRFAVLLDFGIAKELDAPASTVTQDGGVRGTPAYMAPERFFGQPASPRTDIYELGVVLYAMLLGHLPWHSTGDPDARLNPMPPSALGLALPGSLETELLRALSTRPESRPADVRTFLDQINRAADYTAGTQKRQTADLATPPAPQAAGVDPYTRTTPAAPGAIAAAELPTGNNPYPLGLTDSGGLPSPHPQWQAQPGTAPPGYFGQPTPGDPQQPTAGSPAQPGWGRYPQQATPGQYPQQVTPGQYPQQATPGQYPQQPTSGYYPPQAESAPGPATPARPSRAWLPWLLVGLLLVALGGVIVVLGWPDDKKIAVALPDAGAAAAVAPPGASQLVATPEAPAAPRRTADDAMSSALRYHAADTQFVIGLRVRELLASSSLGPLLKKQRDNPEAAPLYVMANLCAIDVFEDVDWVTFGVVDADQQAFDFVLSGNLDKAKIDSCVGQIADNPAGLGWIDDRTFFFSSRDGVDAAWVAERVAGEKSMASAPEIATALAGVDRGATLWFVGAPGDLLGEVQKGTPKPRSVFGNIAVADDLAGDITVRYASPEQAAQAGQALTKELAEIPDGMIGELSVKTVDSDVRLHARLNEMITKMMVGMVEDELARRAQE